MSAPADPQLAALFHRDLNNFTNNLEEFSSVTLATLHYLAFAITGGGYIDLDFAGEGQPHARYTEFLESIEHLPCRPLLQPYLEYRT